MLLTFGRSKFKIRIMYKNGNSHSQWFVKFNTNTDLSKATWETHEFNIKPIVMNIEAVEAVWQEDYRINVFYMIWANTIGALIGLFQNKACNW